jgi:Flp pilus assembly pilin Flp
LKSEKGLTLVELLVAIIIAVFVVGTVSLLFSSVQNMWSKSAQNFNEQSKIQLTLNTISDYLANSNEVFCPNNSELRMRTGLVKTGYAYKALVLQGNRLILYDLVGVTDDTTFTAPSSSLNYSNGMQLADNVSNMTPSPVGQLLQYDKFLTVNITFPSGTKQIRIKLLNDSST